jgi:flagellar M-ring protein FliF
VAEATTTELAVAGGSSRDNPEIEQKSGFMDALSSAEMMRQISLVVALILCVGITVFIIMWAQEPEMRPLAQMETQELIETLDYLDQQQINYKLQGNTVYVNASDFQKIRMGMARQGLSTQASQGNDIILQDMGFGVSQRLERERLKHAREQQLARTIEEITSIKRAKVLLALSRENVFASRNIQGSATVVLTAKRGASIASEEVDSVVDIVASAVQGLTPERVTVSDSHGRLLNSGSQNAASARSRKEYEMEKKREAQYQEKIDSILLPVLGIGKYTASVDVTMDFTAVEQTQRSYNPDLPAVRSEMTVEENSVGGLMGGIPGALTNQPPLDSNIPENATDQGAQRQTPGRTHKEATRNYELDTTISHTKQQTGVVRRVSVSVAVDHVEALAEDGSLSFQPMPQAELLNIRRLLQGGIGFDVTRGDTLEVVSIPFSREDEAVFAEAPIYQQEWFINLMRPLIAGLVIIVLLLFIVRPTMNKLMRPEQTVENAGLETDAALDLGDDPVELFQDDFDESAVRFDADGSLKLPDLHKDEDVLRAVRALVANEPELSAQVVKGWLMQDE